MPDCLTPYGARVPGIPKKPDPTAALGIAKGFSIPPREILYIGDSGVDMLTGKNAGMDSCGVLWGFRDRKELEENGAVFTVGSASELLETVMSPLIPFRHKKSKAIQKGGILDAGQKIGTSGAF